MLPFVRRPWLAGLIVAVPIALVAAAYAAAFLGPNARFAVDLGEARTAAFGAAALLAALALPGGSPTRISGPFPAFSPTGRWARRSR